VASLCEHLVNGGAASQWYGAGDPPNPSNYAIWTWCEADPLLKAQVKAARQAGTHVHVDESVRIADDRQDDPDPASRKVRIWARLEMAKKINPQHYGDKVAIGGDAEAPPIQVDDATAAKRIASILAVAAARQQQAQTQLPDNTDPKE
jgi:hypothetical protein